MRRLTSERGSQLVEFALAATLFFAILFGIMEYSRMIFAYNIVSNAAREGARYAAVRGSASGHAASATDVQTYVVARSFNRLTTGNVSVSWTPNNNPGGTVTVQTTYTFQPAIPLLPQRIVTLNSTAKMIVAR